jgi:hypothetical protein
MHPTEKVVRQFHESWDMRGNTCSADEIGRDCRQAAAQLGNVGSVAERNSVLRMPAGQKEPRP